MADALGPPAIPRVTLAKPAARGPRAMGQQDSLAYRAGTRPLADSPSSRALRDVQAPSRATPGTPHASTWAPGQAVPGPGAASVRSKARREWYPRVVPICLSQDD
jgi:hypothetical protein